MARKRIKRVLWTTKLEDCIVTTEVKKITKVYEKKLDGGRKDITNNIDAIRELRLHGAVQLGLIEIEEEEITITRKYKK